MRNVATGLCACLAITAGFATENFALAKSGLDVIHSFDVADGSYPAAGLIEDQSGNFFGTTFGGGEYGLGAVFQIAPNGNETLLHSFSEGDGLGPDAPLVEDPAGNLYGTATSGGTKNFGTVFKLAPDGSETVLYNFLNNGDGAIPGGIVMDLAGNLYGSTAGAGGSSAAGTIYKLTPDGVLTLLHTFTGGSDGAHPNNLIIDQSGNLFGTTQSGGSGCGHKGCGVAYEIDPSGNESILYNFRGSDDGWYPQSRLTADGAGNLYGTTAKGGTQGMGVVFEIQAAGEETVLHSFAGGSDGSGPFAGVVLDDAGNLYGTTPRGGTGKHGTVYRLAPDRTETILHAFGSQKGGRMPAGNLVIGDENRLYGTTSQGGATNVGTIFRIKE